MTFAMQPPDADEVKVPGSTPSSEQEFEELTGYFKADDWKKDVINGRIIAVGLDSSAESQAAFFWAVNNFIKTSNDSIKNKLVLLTCIPENCSEGNKVRFRNFLQTNFEKARNLIGPNVPLRAIIVYGDPRDGICNMVEKLNADVLVIGTRGLTGVRRAMMGSVSDYLSKHSHCPCLIVRGVC
ncbi:adenine nucleotide alpha hydrolases-like protein [Rhizoclosmatium globosum]|uniref:Adenine nucleotide alpha hydrolases-like protein n=1 Tax=Rhizoclosmatium globosum TaxID=329046 RepID=A0A1Y2CYC4_9FUNG|nr:adenine nucleotide alpha hydrolases-like protein [Rhizoclosmatium globosum]|eukprot:ORY52041.1 adenine nucleotide alpha hydrolases-like protein [Rhizoclosmatium globosum]